MEQPLTAPSFSVLIPVHNGQTWLKEALDSALEQDPPPFEVIVVNDGSTDDTEVILRGYGDRIVFISQKRAGVAAARNRGIEAARAEWIAFLDADDRWRPGHLAGLGRIIAANPQAGLVYSDAMTIDEAGRAVKPQPARDPGPDPFRDLVLQNFIINSAAAARKNLVVEAGGIRPGLRHGVDWDLWLRLARLAPVVRTAGVTVDYRCHRGGVVGTGGRDMRDSNLGVLDWIERTYPEVSPRLLRRARARRFEESSIRCLVREEPGFAKAEALSSIRLWPWRVQPWVLLLTSLGGHALLSPVLTFIRKVRGQK